MTEAENSLETLESEMAGSGDNSRSKFNYVLESFGDTTVLQFGTICLGLTFIILISWMHYSTKFEASNILKRSYNKQW